MLAVYVDFNSRERLPDGGQAVGIPIGSMNPDGLERNLKVGTRIVLYDEDIRCFGVLRRGEWIEGWVADIIPGSVMELNEGEFKRLRVATQRGAIRIL